jgi:hypothetical protein
MIALADALNIMEKKNDQGEPEPFSLRCVTYNEQLQTGGEFLEIEKGVLNDSRESIIEASPLQKLNADIHQREERLKKNPHHSENFTRNIRILPGNNIRKIHALLITEFNGEKVF